MEATSDQKGYADLKSEFGQMRADISAIMNFLGMTDKKHKSHNDMNRQRQGASKPRKHQAPQAHGQGKHRYFLPETLMKKTLMLRQIPTIKVKWSALCLHE